MASLDGWLAASVSIVRQADWLPRAPLSAAAGGKKESLLLVCSLLLLFSSFFGETPLWRWPRVEALSERVELLLLSRQFLRTLGDLRPDVASNLLRHESGVLAARLAAADPLAHCALSLTGIGNKTTNN